MLKKRILLISFICIPFITKALDSDSRLTREVVLEIDATLIGTFTVLDDLDVTLCKKFQGTWTTLAATDTQITVTCDPVPITSAGTISTPGTYCLANDIAGLITIATNDVVLDGNGHVIMPTDTGIDVSASTTNVIIRNVTIDGGTAEAIVVRANCSNVIIEDSLILNCGTQTVFQFAILFDNAENSVIDNVVIINCRSGIELDTSTNFVIKNCDILQCNNSGAGSSVGIRFDASDNIIVESCRVKELFADLGSVIAFQVTTFSSQLIFKKCIAEDIGDGNSGAISFTVSSGGLGANVVFEDCIAKNSLASVNNIGFSAGSTDFVVYNRCKALHIDSLAGTSDGFFASNMDCVVYRDCESSSHSVGVPGGGRGWHIDTAGQPMIINCIACENSTEGFFVINSANGVMLKNTAKGNGDNGFELVGATPTDWVLGKNVSIGNGARGFTIAVPGANRVFGSFAQGNATGNYSGVTGASIAALGASPKPTGANISA